MSAIATKAGAIILRNGDGGAEVLLVRPVAKRPGGTAPWVLPRGSRQYRDAGGAWRDVRSLADAAPVSAEAWEPSLRNFAREVCEEAGFTPELLRSNLVRVMELGARVFASGAQHEMTSVAWFVVQVMDAAAVDAQLMRALPEDAAEMPRWVAVRGLQQMRDLSQKYIPLIEEAVAKLDALPMVALPPLSSSC